MREVCVFGFPVPLRTSPAVLREEFCEEGTAFAFGACPDALRGFFFVSLGRVKCTAFFLATMLAFFIGTIGGDSLSPIQAFSTTFSDEPGPDLAINVYVVTPGPGRKPRAGRLSAAHPPAKSAIG